MFKRLTQFIAILGITCTFIPGMVSAVEIDATTGRISLVETDRGTVINATEGRTFDAALVPKGERVVQAYFGATECSNPRCEVQLTIITNHPSGQYHLLVSVQKGRFSFRQGKIDAQDLVTIYYDVPATKPKSRSKLENADRLKKST